MRFLLFLLLFALNSFGQGINKLEIMPCYDTKIDSNKSYLYCASSVLMWNSFTDYLRETPKSKVNSEFVNGLNSQVKKALPLEKEFYVAGTGRPQEGILGTINEELQRKFLKHWSPDYSFSENPLISYAYLEKNVIFHRNLSDHFYQKPFNANVDVDFFGIDFDDPNYTRKDILIYDYQNKDNFIVEIKTKDSLDEIYFAKIPLDENLYRLYENVLKRVEKGKKEAFTGSDQLRIPYLKLDTLLDFKELKGIEFENDNLENAAIGKVNQSILLDLNEQGIRLKSEMSMIIDFPSFDYEKTRILAFDQPFLMVMKRRNSPEPYFLYWVNGAECMRAYYKKGRQIEEHEKALVGRWKIDHKIRIDSTFFQYESDLVIEYLVDGTFKIISPNSPVTEGTWKLSKDQKTLVKQFYRDQISGDESIDIIESITDEYIIESDKGKVFYKRLNNE